MASEIIKRYGYSVTIVKKRASNESKEMKMELKSKYYTKYVES